MLVSERERERFPIEEAVPSSCTNRHWLPWHRYTSQQGCNGSTKPLSMDRCPKGGRYSTCEMRQRQTLAKICLKGTDRRKASGPSRSAGLVYVKKSLSPGRSFFLRTSKNKQRLSEIPNLRLPHLQGQELPSVFQDPCLFFDCTTLTATKEASVTEHMFLSLKSSSFCCQESKSLEEETLGEGCHELLKILFFVIVMMLDSYL